MQIGLSEIIISLIVAIITWLATKLYTNFLYPYIQGKVLRVSDISGAWAGFDVEDDQSHRQTSRMEIKQTGVRVKAEVVRTTKIPGRKFIYRGEFIAGQLVLNWEEKSGEGYNLGSMVMHLSGDLKTLTGKITYYHKDNSKVVCLDKVYRRSS